MADIPSTSESLIKHLGNNATSAKWAEFVEIYLPLMRDFCRGMYPDLDADDLIQETLIALVKVLPNYKYEPEARGLFHNYLIGILKHKAFSRYAKRKRNRELELEWLTEQEDSGNNKEFENLRQLRIEIAIRELLADSSIHNRSKQIFIEVAIKGKSPAEVAAAFGVTRNSVDQIRSRLTKRLKEIVDNLHME